MATQYTSLLGLALPVTGELSGTWGDTVNDSITSLLDTAVAGTTSLTTDTDVTLSTTTGAANQARQAIILWAPASGTVTRNITAPARSKIYTVINASGGTQSIVFRGVGPTTGVTIVKGESAIVAWNGSDFIKVSNTGGSASFTNVTVTGTTTLSALTASTALALDSSKNVVSVTNTGTGNNVLSASPTLTGTVSGASLQLSSLTSGRVTFAGASGLLSDSSSLTWDGTTLVASNLTDSSLTSGRVTFATTGGNLADAAGLTWDGTNLTASQLRSSGLTSGRVTYASTSGLLVDSANMTFNGTRLTVADLADSGLTAGRVVYVGSGSALVDSANLLFDGTTLSTTGVRLNSSSSIADGVGNASFTPTSGGSLSITSNGSYTNGNIVYNALAAGGVHAWQINNAEQMRLTSTGLGIGTSSPATKLDVNGGFAVSGSISGFGGGEVRLGTSAANTQNAISTISTGTPEMFFDHRGTSTGIWVWRSGANTRMTLDSSGNLGLGVTPSAINLGKTLEVGALGCGIWTPGDRNTVFTSNAYYNGSNRYATTGPAGQYQIASGVHYWYTAPSGTAGNAISFTQAMTLDASGNLGVGTTSPTPYGASNRVLQIDGGNNSSELRLTNNTTGSGASNGALFQQAGNDLYIWNVENSFLSFGTNNTERARIDSSGNLLIGGTTANGARLSVGAVPNDVVGTQAAFFAGAKTSFAGIAQLPQNQLFVYDTNSSAGSGGAISFGGNAAGQQTWYAAIEARKDNGTAGDYAGSMVFYTRPSGTTAGERMRIDSSGRLLLGSSSTNSSNATTQLQITYSSNTGPGLLIADTTIQNNSTFATFVAGTTRIGSITANGTTAVAYNTSSDYRLKHDIQPMTGALAKVQQLKPCTYKWNVDDSEGEGFIAHELAEVCPDAVSGEKDAVDAEGNPVYQGIDTSFLVATLTAAIQELKAEFDAYKATHP